MIHRLHISIDTSHPAYEWASKQADRVGALGHVGTHIDCYTKGISEQSHLLACVTLDLRSKTLDDDLATMPDLEGKALLLYTGNLSTNGYASERYFQEDTSLNLSFLEKVLQMKPAFLFIDSHGIGVPGIQHKEYDRLCEEHGCHVVENVVLPDPIQQRVLSVSLQIDLHVASSGKPCEIFVLETE